MILPTMILVFRKNFQFSFLQNLLIIAQIKNRTPDFETSIVFFMRQAHLFLESPFNDNEKLILSSKCRKTFIVKGQIYDI